MSSKIAGYLEIIGLVTLVVSSMAWMSHGEWVPYVYTLGAVIFAVGRLTVQQTIGSDNISDAKLRITVKRLLRQRSFAVFALLFSAMLMFMQPGWYLGNNFYLTRFAWFVPFLVFVIIEVYTAFRLPSVLKKC